MKTKKLALYTGVAAIVLAAGATTLVIQANEPTESSTPMAAAETTSGPAITIYKSPNCGCCQSWAEHLDANGFETTVVETDDLNEIKQQYNVPREAASCHTALIGDVVIEGHVPADDIVAYLENPQFNTLGLSVPGMVQGSPGMETGKKEDYQVIAFSANGQQSVFREHKDY
ncbi:MAG: CopG family transcriptional regulator [Alteromonadaceae bacterium]|nr:CopG family transcriptional regulator [Alteromonadaceae bacterium]|tara:strand:- start:542 stop:1057 length:516 start_codon:yes stop_codon:yes gene_type:complete